eukprot:4204598-Prymnesium_polylepis.1
MPRALSRPRSSSTPASVELGTWKLEYRNVPQLAINEPFTHTNNTHTTRIGGGHGGRGRAARPYRAAWRREGRVTPGPG